MWLFPRDNNGLLVTLPAVSPTGAPSATGTLVFGIGTQANNGLGSARVYATDDSGNVTTNFNGVDYTGSVRVGAPIQGTLSAGAYCVALYDLGNVTGADTYTLTVLHP